MKINKRLLLIFAISSLAAVMLTGVLYYVMVSEADPVKQVSIPVLSTQLEKDAVIKDIDITTENYNAATVPNGVIRDRKQLINKKVSVKIHPGEFIFSSDIAERGDVSDPLKSLYIIGIDVDNISNFLGTQLEMESVYYVLNGGNNIEVRVAGLVDSTGNAVYGEHQVQIKTVNLGVKTMADLNQLRQLEIADGIELVKYPDK